MEIIRAYRYRIYPTPEQHSKLLSWVNALRALWNMLNAEYYAVQEIKESLKPKVEEPPQDIAVPTARGSRRKAKKEKLAIEQQGLADTHREGRPRPTPYEVLQIAPGTVPKWPSRFGQCKRITVFRKENSWLDDVPVRFCQSIPEDLAKAWKKCWEGKGVDGAPRFKSKKRGDTVALRTPAVEARFVLPLNGKGGAIVLPKLGAIDTAFYRPPVGKPLVFSVVQEVGEEWWASIVCEQTIEEPAPSTLPPVGIDMGVVNLIADSNGRIVENPRFDNAFRGKMRRLQRALARKVHGSSNAKCNKNAIARLHRRVRRKRDLILQVESKWYAKNHGLIIVEDLKLRSMMASAKGTVETPGKKVKQKSGLNRALAGAALGRFVTLVQYKVIPMGGRVKKVPPEFSSQTCSVCGCVDKRNRLSQAKFKCISCGHQENADTNASKVLCSRGVPRSSGV